MAPRATLLCAQKGEVLLGSNMFAFFLAIYASLYQFQLERTLVETHRNTFIDSGTCFYKSEMSFPCHRKSTRWRDRGKIKRKDTDECIDNDNLCSRGAGIREYDNVKKLLEWKIENIVNYYQVEYIPASGNRELKLYTGRDFALFSNVARVEFLMESCEGDIYSLHVKKQIKMSYGDINLMSSDILNAIHSLHARKHYHLDIKPLNIVKCLSNGEIIYKLIDFEYMTDRNQVTSRRGTKAYAPMQVNEALEEESISNKVWKTFDADKWDMISFGKTIYHMFYTGVSFNDLKMICFESNSINFPKKIHDQDLFPSDEAYTGFLNLMSVTMNCNWELIISASELRSNAHKNMA
eukprot:NODE_677_length_4824_cov_0.791323.p1 type:complete len:351 gc:universal NODE_677_length_4824_cov_0.791323:1656-2708(+)